VDFFAGPSGYWTLRIAATSKPSEVGSPPAFAGAILAPRLFGLGTVSALAAFGSKSKIRSLNVRFLATSEVTFHHS